MSRSATKGIVVLMTAVFALVSTPSTAEPAGRVAAECDPERVYTGDNTWLPVDPRPYTIPFDPPNAGTTGDEGIEIDTQFGTYAYLRYTHQTAGKFYFDVMGILGQLCDIIPDIPPPPEPGVRPVP